MNNRQIAALCLVAFAIGEQEGIIRLAKLHRRQTKKLNKEIEILKLKNELACWAIIDARYLNEKEKAIQLKEKVAFIEIVLNDK